MDDTRLKDFAKKALTNQEIMKELQNAWTTGPAQTPGVPDSQLSSVSGGTGAANPFVPPRPDEPPTPDQIDNVAGAIATAVNSGNTRIADIVDTHMKK